MVLANHQTVVVGVDGSPNSVAAVHWATTLAERLSSPLHIAIAVQEPTFLLAESPNVVPTEVWGRQRHNAAELVAELSESIGRTHPSVTVTTQVDSVSAAEMLTTLSRTSRLVVVGNSGTGMLASNLLGSTAKKIADTAACPVVVWRAGAHADDAPIVVGVDGSATSEAAVAQAFELASLFAVSLVAVHTWNSISHGGAVAFPGFVDWSAVENEEALLLSESLAGWTEKYPDVQVEHVLQQSSPAPTLVELSSRAQLVVVGSRGRGAIARALLGSTSSNLAHHAQCPVMICRDAQ